MQRAVFAPPIARADSGVKSSLVVQHARKGLQLVPRSSFQPKLKSFALAPQLDPEATFADLVTQKDPEKPFAYHFGYYEVRLWEV